MSQAPEVKRKYRRAIFQKICSYFKIPRAKQEGIVDLDMETFGITLEGLPFDEEIYASHLDSVTIDELLHYPKFLKRLHPEFINGEGGAESPHKFVMALVLRDSIFFIRRGLEYRGSGGIFMGDKKESFIIEPLANFLTDNYPKYEE